MVTEWTAPTENGTMRASEASRAGPSDAGPSDAEPGDTEPSDAEIIVRSRREPDGFAQIFDRHAAEILRYAHTRLGPDRAEDVTAETFLAAFRRRDHYDPAWPDARPWLFGIAIRLIGKHWRAEARYRRMLATTPVPAAADDDFGDRRPSGSPRSSSGRNWPPCWISCPAGTVSCCSWWPGPG